MQLYVLKCKTKYKFEMIKKTEINMTNALNRIIAQILSFN